MNLLKRTILFMVMSSFTAFSQEGYNKIILKEVGGKKIEWDRNNDWIAKIQLKENKKWGLYRFEIEDFYPDDSSEEPEQIVYKTELIPPIYDAISTWETPDLTLSSSHLYLKVTKDGKHSFLACDIYDNSFEPYTYDVIYFDEIEIIDKQYAAIRSAKLWGVYDWVSVKVLIEPEFKTKEEIPFEELDDWDSPNQKIKRLLNADEIINDPNNGDGTFIAKNKDTQKWGMYQNLYGDEPFVMIPCEYDEINFIPFNGAFTTVIKEDKIGVYLSAWSYNEEAKQTVDCLYDDYQRFNADGVTKLAMKKNGKWGWVDWLTGEEKSQFIYETTKELPYPYYQQKSWLDE